MNKLQLVQKLVRLADIAQSGPSTTINQTGDYLKAVNYINDAYDTIQNEYLDWNFLWINTSLTTTAGIGLYAGGENLSMWDSKRIYYDNAPLDIERWTNYCPDTSLSNSKPEYAVIRPDNQLLVVPTPDGEYTISYDYYRTPDVMDADDSVPIFPASFHLAIVAEALIEYGNFESADEAKVQGVELKAKYMPRLEASQLPDMQQTWGRAESVDITVVPE